MVTSAPLPTHASTPVVRLPTQALTVRGLGLDSIKLRCIVLLQCLIILLTLRVSYITIHSYIDIAQSDSIERTIRQLPTNPAECWLKAIFTRINSKCASLLVIGLHGNLFVWKPCLIASFCEYPLNNGLYFTWIILILEVTSSCCYMTNRTVYTRICIIISSVCVRTSVLLPVASFCQAISEIVLNSFRCVRRRLQSRINLQISICERTLLNIFTRIIIVKIVNSLWCIVDVKRHTKSLFTFTVLLICWYITLITHECQTHNLEAHLVGSSSVNNTHQIGISRLGVPTNLNQLVPVLIQRVDSTSDYWKSTSSIELRRRDRRVLIRTYVKLERERAVCKHGPAILTSENSNACHIPTLSRDRAALATTRSETNSSRPHAHLFAAIMGRAKYDLSVDKHMIPCKLSASLNFWENNLVHDADRDYILKGIKEGFDILEGKNPIFSADCNNYLSASRTMRIAVEKQIRVELAHDNYIHVYNKPRVVSALGAIPKTGGKIRIIHDLSRPNLGVNQFVDSASCSFQTIDNATQLLANGGYLSKIDLKSAYRSVPIHPRNYTYMGLAWYFGKEKERSYLFDSRLPFGSKKACQVFQKLSDSVAKMLKEKGISLVNYLDDLLIVSPTKEKCWLDLDMSINVLTKLGFVINWDKVSPPTQIITFLGVQINAVSRSLTLPQDKLTDLKCLLNTWLTKKKCSKKDLLKFLGKLNWACRVVRGGRTFMRRLIDLSKTLRLMHHRGWLNVETRKDILWWSSALEIFHGHTQFIQDIPPPRHRVRDGRLSDGRRRLIRSLLVLYQLRGGLPGFFQ